MFVCFVWQLFFVCLRLQCCEVLPFLAAVVIGQISECSGFSAEPDPIANLGALPSNITLQCKYVVCIGYFIFFTFR